MLDALRQHPKDYDRRRQGRGKKPKQIKAKAKQRIQKMVRQALRCGIARHLTGEAYRVFSCRLADSPVLQKFCLIDGLVAIKVPSKSQLQRYEGMFGEEFLREIICQVTGKAAEPEAAEEQEQVLGLEHPISISLKDYFEDTTCLGANIHYPVDWTLLRDASFCEKQKRRGQTEGRIGIVKNVFLGSPLRSKGLHLTANECCLGGTFSQSMGDSAVAAASPSGSTATTGCIEKTNKAEYRKKRTGELRPK